MLLNFVSLLPSAALDVGGRKKDVAYADIFGHVFDLRIYSMTRAGLFIPKRESPIIVEIFWFRPSERPSKKCSDRMIKSTLLIIYGAEVMRPEIPLRIQSLCM